MESHITFKEKDSEGNECYYVLQKEFPHYLGVIVTYPKKNLVDSSPIAGYNFWICFSGTIRGNFAPSYKNVSDEIVVALDNMALWYLNKIILPNKEKYNKFKIR